MTKAARIREIGKAHPEWSSGDIAEACRRQGIDVSASYVRTAARQRVGGKSSDSDRAYWQSSLGKATSKRNRDAWTERFVEEHGAHPKTLHYRNDPAYRASERARKRAFYAANRARERQRRLDYYHRRKKAEREMRA